MAIVKTVSVRSKLEEVPVLIRAFGEFWRADFVDWDNGKPSLWGKRGRGEKLPLVNVYEERGVYVLYKDFLPVYVGKADSEPLGSRLRKQKYATKRGPRWDRFSWFGIRAIDSDGKIEQSRDEGIAARSDVLIETLEAVLILAINPLLNARSESFKNAERLYQFDDEKPRTRVEKQLETIKNKLDSLLSLREE